MPLVGQAQLPLYPSVAWGLGVSGRVVIAMEVDDGGASTARVVSSSSKYLTAPTLNNAQSWRFQRGMPGSFDITYIYKLQGSTTDLPESPKVVLDLPSSVTVIAHPFKPTRSDGPADREVRRLHR
jgi:hypothetical protein